MKTFLSILSLVFSIPGFSQLNNNTGCHAKCSRASARSIQQADFYQSAAMDKYDLKYLKLDLNVQAGNLFLSGTALTTAKALQALDSFNIELRDNMLVDSVLINGVRKNFTRASDHILIPLVPALPEGSMVSALFYYSGTPGSGVFAGTNVGNGHLTYTATLSESFQAREWFPAKQVLKDKFDSADIWITTDAMYKAGSNGLLVAVADSPVNRKQYQWKSRYPMSYYMPCFSVGNYLEYSNYSKPAAIAPDSLLVLNYIVNDSAFFNAIRPNLDMTPRFIEKFSELYGLYPFKNEKYGHTHAYIGACMEHQTMSTMSVFGSTVIAHELSHQWFGDNVTCAKWNDIWVNEGFAAYSEYLAIENLPLLFPTLNPADYMLNIHNDVLSVPEGSVYVPDSSAFDENRIFSGRFTYNKGSAIIHNLRFEMQDDNLFFQTLKNYQQQFKDSVATGNDFKHVAEVTSGKDFTDFFNQWYYGEGYPTFNIIYTRQGTDSIILQVNEVVSAPAVTPFFKGLYEFKITSAQGDTTVKAYIGSNDQQVKFPYNKIPNGIIVDPNNWVLNKTGTIINGGVVPVKLTSFEVSSLNCKALLKWKTNNEQLIKQYDIESSKDGIVFSKVGSVPAKNVITESTYQYNYALGEGGRHFFRLKIIDSDGHYSYSQIAGLSDNCSGSFTLSLSPNPVSKTLYLQIVSPVDENTNIRILNAAGAVIYNKVKALKAGENKLELDIVNKLPHGTYILKAENQDGIITKKFIKD